MVTKSGAKGSVSVQDRDFQVKLFCPSIKNFLSLFDKVIVLENIFTQTNHQPVDRKLLTIEP